MFRFCNPETETARSFAAIKHLRAKLRKRLKPLSHPDGAASTWRQPGAGKQSGSVVVLFVVGLSAFVGLSALAVDVAVIMTIRNQMQAAVDAGALAAASGLTVSQGEGTNRGIQIAGQNNVLGSPLNLDAGEITFPGPRTARVEATRAFGLFFARAFNLDSTEITGTAIAELGNRDIVIVFDRSGSMDDDTVDPNIPQPITDTQNAAAYFVDLVIANPFVLDRIGLVSYATNATLDLNLGRDFNAIKNTLDNYAANGWTNIGDAIKKARQHLVDRTRWRTNKVIILLSDGRANRPSGNGPGYARRQARIAARNSIKVFTISLGSHADFALMAEIASITGGTHFYSPTPAELDAIFQEIADWVPLVLVQ